MKKIVVIISLILLLNAFLFLPVSASETAVDENYAIVLPYKTNSSECFGRVWDGVNFVAKTWDANGKYIQVVYQSQGVIDGKLVKSFFVNVLIDGNVKTVCLADYAYTNIVATPPMPGLYTTYTYGFTDDKPVNTKIENLEVAETVMYNDFLYRFSTYQINADGKYIFRVSDLPVNDRAVLYNTSDENQGYFNLGDVSFRHVLDDVISLSSWLGITGLTVQEDTTFIIKYFDGYGQECYYTWKGNRLLFDGFSVFSNAIAIIENNRESSVTEKLVVFYGETTSFTPPKEEHPLVSYCVVTDVINLPGEPTYVTVYDIREERTFENVQLGAGAGYVKPSDIVTLDDKGRVEYVSTSCYEDVSDLATYLKDTENLYYVSDKNLVIACNTGNSVYKNFTLDDLITLEGVPGYAIVKTEQMSSEELGVYYVHTVYAIVVTDKTDLDAEGGIHGGEIPGDKTPVISVGTGEVLAGKSISIPVTISENPGISGMVLKLEYDEHLKLEEITKGEALSGLTFTPPGDLTPHTLNLLWDGQDGDFSEGEILVLGFAVAEDSPEGKYEINLSYIEGDIRDDDLESVSATIINGGIDVFDCIPGDVNGDETINSLDITLIRRDIAGGYGVKINRNAADVNDDGVVNSLDITLIRRYIAGGYGVELK